MSDAICSETLFPEFPRRVLLVLNRNAWQNSLMDFNFGFHGIHDGSGVILQIQLFLILREFFFPLYLSLLIYN